MEHYSALYKPPVVKDKKRWACWAFMQSLWDNGVPPTNAMLESFLRNMYPDDEFKSGNLCELAYFRHTVMEGKPMPEKPL